MTSIGPGHPPVATRFRKGQSGNPRGRPKAKLRPSPSAFEIMTGRTFTITQGGQQREVTVEEALQQRIYQDALAGKRLAQREVLKMIVQRERWLASKRANSHSVTRLLEPTDPDNGDEALLLLGIAKLNERSIEVRQDRRPWLLLEPWAVQLALSRGRRRLSAEEVSSIKRCTRDPETLRWPAGARDEQD